VRGPPPAGPGARLARAVHRPGSVSPSQARDPRHSLRPAGPYGQQEIADFGGMSDKPENYLLAWVHCTAAVTVTCGPGT
jgi:hypothetical protein